MPGERSASHVAARALVAGERLRLQRALQDGAALRLVRGNAQVLQNRCETMLHLSVDARLGSHGAPDNQGACAPQNASRFLYEGLPAFGGTDNLNQQHRIERIIAKRQTPPVGLQKRRTKARLIAPTRKLAQHAEREIDGNVVIIGRHECAPNSSGSAPDVEQPRPRCCGDRVEDCRADRRRHMLGQRPMQIEAVRYRVMTRRAILHDPAGRLR